MTNLEIIQEISKTVGLSMSDSKKALAATVQVITKAVVSGEKATVSGLGIFEPIYRPERTMKDPRTRDPIDVPAKWAVKFRPSSALKAAVASGER